MAKDVEIKARLTKSQFQQVAGRAAELAERGPLELEQCDTFFHSKSGRLKLREFADGSAELIHYHRDDQAGPKSSGYALIPCPDPTALKAALAAANGIRGVVKKQRTVYFTGPTRIHLDRVEGLGDFLELEVVVEAGRSCEPGAIEQGEPPSKEDPVGLAHRLMDQLGIEPSMLVATAYIDLLAR